MHSASVVGAEGSVRIAAAAQDLYIRRVRYRFVGYELDTEAYKLRRGGHEVRLQPQVFDVLRYLVEHHARVVSKDELLSALWSDPQVNDAAVAWSISHARRALGQTRGARQPIETIHGRGYRLAADVQLVAGNTSAPPDDIDEETAPQSPEPQPIAALPFVGRDALMAELHAQLSDAGAGAGRMCLLVGEAGIGKTRCASELARGARARGVTVLSGRSVEGVGAPVYWPWQQIVRELLQAQPELRPPGDALLAQLSAAEAGAQPVAAAARGGRLRMFEELTRLLRTAAEASSLLLVFDDLHWADAGTLELLSFSASEWSRARLMVLGTQREEFGSHLAETASELARRAQTYKLGYLTPRDIAQYVARITHQAEPTPMFCDALLAATAGNPLFVQETVRGLIAQVGAAGLAALSPSAIQPSKLARDVLRVPLRALAAEELALLSIASVLGEVFELTLLTQVAALDIDTLLDRLDAPLARGFVLAEAPNRYRFQHALVRTILYDDVKPTERVATHRRAAELLSQLPEREQHASEIAIHYYRSLAAGDPAAVTAAALRAAAIAERAHAFQDASMYFGWALESQALDSSVTARDRAELLLRSGKALRWAGRERGTRRTLKLAIELATQAKHGDVLVHAARVLRPTHAISSLPDELVREALEQALRTAPEGPDPVRISALSQLACVPPLALDLEQSKHTSAIALDLARQLWAKAGNDTVARASMFEALRARLYSLSGPDDIEASIAASDEILALDQPTTDLSWDAYSARFSALLHRGDMNGACRALDALGRLGDELNMPETRWYHERQRAQLLLMRGQFAETSTASKTLLENGRRMGLSYAYPFVLAIRGRLSYFRNGPAAMKAQVEATGATVFSEWPPSLCSHGILLAVEAGDFEAARGQWQTLARGEFDNLTKEVSYLLTLCNAAVIAVALDDRPRAEKLYQLLSPYPHHNTLDLMLMSCGSVSHFLARLAAATGRNNRVEDHYSDALAMNERIQHMPKLARTYYEYASWLRTQPGVSARERSRVMARRACELSDSLGMGWLSDPARVLASAPLRNDA